MSILTNGSSDVAPRVLRVGIVGAGEVAQTTHLPTLQQLNHLFKVVALCDVSQDSLKHCATKYGVRKTYTDFSDMAKDSEIDVVMILTADEYHAAYAVEAADNGKAVFIEKPMALTHADAQSIIDAEARNKVTIFVGYMRRYATAFEVAKKEIQSIKKIDYVRVRDIIGFNHFFVDQCGFFPAKFIDFPAESNEDRLARGEKIAQAALGELTKNPRNKGLYRLLGGLGSHDLSAMRELIGLPKSCFAASRPSSAPFLTAMFEYEGFTALYETGIDDVAKFDAHIEVHGEGKRIKVTYDTPYIKGLPIIVTILEADSEGQFQERIIRPTYKDAYTIELEELHRCVVDEAPCKTSPSDAAEDLKIFDMIMGALKN